jgi:hypothetical protein
MKIFRYCTILATLIVGAQNPCLARGGMDSGGGDTFAMEFVAIGHQALDYLVGIEKLDRPDALKGLVNLDSLRGALSQTQIETRERVYLGTEEKDAINIPSESKIILSRSRWAALRPAHESKLAIVLHEYLGIIGLADSAYEISHKFLARLTTHPLLTIESYVVHCESALKDHPEWGGIKFDLYNIGEHFAWVQLTAAQRGTDNGPWTFIPEKVLRNIGSDGDYFSVADDEEALYIELSDTKRSGRLVMLSFDESDYPKLDSTLTCNAVSFER